MRPLDDVLPQFDARERHLALRGLDGRDCSVADLLASIGAAEVARRDDVAVFVRGGRIAIAIAFWAERDGSASILRTETRVRAADRAARRRFRAYWLVVRPLSGLIRRRWLHVAAQRAAERR